ncbi:MAG: hypothetical protein RMJ15_01130 [Nitrososphaerota archaeon]|nr:hypothetical protein [Candidatus Bathyarchaeota archaeon]MDW8022337.1 hypothetical protein [Nitrososphaerota archaeon]
MWTYTAYILSKYLAKEPSKETELKFAEFANFVFKVLWRQEKLIFHDSIEDLLLDIKYLEKLGIVALREDENLEKITISVRDKVKLRQAAKIVEESATLTGVELFNTYVQKINRAVESLPVAP